MPRISRRDVLKVSGAGAVTAKTGGLAAILGTGRSPAYAQTTTVHILRWNDFVPACDQLLRQKLFPEAAKQLGIKVNFETVNGNDLQPRITSAIQSGAGPDLVKVARERFETDAEGEARRRAIAERQPAAFQRRFLEALKALSRESTAARSGPYLRALAGRD